jgi:hypothetical protein
MCWCLSTETALHHTLKDQLLNIHHSCEILGFCISAVEVSTFVECCAPLISTLLLTFLDNELVLLSRVEQARGNSSWTAWPLKLGPIYCPTVLAAIYQPPPCSIPGKWRLHHSCFSICFPNVSLWKLKLLSSLHTMCLYVSNSYMLF